MHDRISQGFNQNMKIKSAREKIEKKMQGKKIENCKLQIY